jgi:hypothetical protein
MNTGFSTAAISPAVVFPRGFSPDFFKRPKAPDDRAALAEGISFPQRAGETVIEFEESPQFPLFAYEFMVHLDCIKRFADEHLDDTAHEISRVFDDLGRRLFDPDYAFFGEEKNILYGVGMRSLRQFASQLADSALNLAQRKNSVLQLTDGVQECAAGAAVNLADAASMLQSMLGGEFQRIRESVATALVVEFHQSLDMSNISPTYEIHSATRLRNEISETLGVEKIEDPLAEHCHYTPKEIEDCRQHVLRHFTPARLAMALAEEYLEAFRQPVIASLKGGDPAVNLSAPFDYQQFSEDVSTAKEPLNNYGDVDMRSLLTYTDENFSHARLNADPSLVALDILDGQQRNGTVAENYRATTLLKWRHLDTEICVMHHAAQIAWATENNESRLLGAKHLLLMHPREFKGKEDLAKRILANVITNEAPEMLQACLSLPWLSIADAQQVFASWTPAAISRYLRLHSMQITALPRFRKLAIIKGIVAHGTLSDLALFVQNGLTLFAEPHDKTRILPSFLTIALLRGDHQMLGTLGTLLLNAAGKRIPLTTGNAMFMAVNARGVSVLHAVLTDKADNPALSQLGEIATNATLRQLMTSAELEEVLSARNAYGTPAFLFAMRNNDDTKVRDFGTIVMDALKHDALDGTQAETLLRADNGGGAPALYFAAINDCGEAIIAYSSVVLSGHSEGLLTQKQASDLITGRTDEAGTVLLCAINYGNDHAVTCYGKVLSIATEYKALTLADICEVLGGGSASKTYVIEAALYRNQASTITAFGDILLNFYKSGVVNKEQVCTILGGADPARALALMKSLASNHDAAIDALAQIVFKAEVLRRKTEGPASHPLAISHRQHQDALPPVLAAAASTAELEAIAGSLKTLRTTLQPGEKLSDDIKVQIWRLHKRMQKSCLGLFFCPAAAGSPKAELLPDIVGEWSALARLLRSVMLEPD